MALKKVKKKKKSVKKKKVMPKPSLGKYSVYATSAHDRIGGLLRSMGKTQGVGKMLKLKVERIPGGVLVSYQFDWRAVPDHVTNAGLVDMTITLMENTPWVELPSIVINPTETQNRIAVALTW